MVKTLCSHCRGAVIAAKEGNVNNAKVQLNNAISKDASLEAKAKKDVNLASLF